MADSGSSTSGSQCSPTRVYLDEAAGEIVIEKALEQIERCPKSK